MNHPHLVLQGGMDIDLERSPDIGMAQHLAQALDVHTLLHAARRIGVPLRYNKDKRKNPVFSRVSAFVVAYSIPFPTLIVNEKSVE